MMSEPRDDTTNPSESPASEQETEDPTETEWAETGSYYYDDSTGYEKFIPDVEDDEEKDEDE
jgi:hypothetical protein